MLKKVAMLMMSIILILVNVRLVIAEVPLLSVSALVGSRGNMVEEKNVDIPTTVTITSKYSSSKNIIVTLKVKNSSNVVLYFETQETSVISGGQVTVSTMLPGLDKYGFYNLDVYIEETNTREELANDFFEFALVNLPKSGTRNSKLGIINHVRHTRMGDPLINLQFIDKAGFSTTRSEVTWAAYEKEKGNYKLTDAYSNAMEAQAENGLGHLEILAYQNALYGNELPPVSDATLEAYANFGVNLVGDLQKKLGDSNLEVEVWNEYNNFGHFNSDKQPAEMHAKMLKAIYPKLKAKYPDLKVWGMSTYRVDTNWILKVLDAGGGDYLDGISIHPYNSAFSPENGGAIEQLVELKKILKEKGYENIPLRATEWGWPSCGKNGYPDDIGQASYFVRMNVLNEVNDIFEHIDWYTINDGGINDNIEYNFGLLRGPDTKVPYGVKPSYLAAANYNTLMNEAIYVDSLKIGTDVTAYRFKLADGRDCVTAWKVNDGNELATINLGTDKATMIDMYGNENEVETVDGAFYVNYGIEPVYLVGNFSKLAKATVMNQTIINGGTIVEYDNELRKVKVYGKYTEQSTEETLGILVIPESENVANLDFSKVLYIDEIKAYDGIFSKSFSVGKDTYGKFKLLLKLPNNASPGNFNLGYVTEGNYNLVCTFEINGDSSSVTASTYIKNANLTAQSVHLLIAQYDEKGTLLKVNSEKYTIAANSAAALYKVSDVRDENAAYSKAFIWDGYNSIKPIVQSIERREQ